MNYLDFELSIGTETGGEYPVSVAKSRVAGMRLPLERALLDQRLREVEAEVSRSSTVRRNIGMTARGESPVATFGSELWKALMSDAVCSRFRKAQEKARAEGKGLRLRLCIGDPTLAALPWEFLYDPDKGDYVCLSGQTPLVRYVELEHPPVKITVTPPLSILAMVSSPTDLPRLDVEHEKRRIEDATKESRDKELIRFKWLDKATWSELQQALRRGEFHIFHFVGHGGFDGNEGVLAFENDNGAKALMRATEVGRLLEGHRTLQMAVLNSCLGAKASAENVFSSTAAVLARRDLPAVIAMQYEISDPAAIEFSRTLYAAIADGMPIDAAVSEARKAISFAAQHSVEWGTPVLHMRAPDGVLFDISPRTELPTAPRLPLVEHDLVGASNVATRPKSGGRLKMGLVGVGLALAVAFMLILRSLLGNGSTAPERASAGNGVVASAPVEKSANALPVPPPTPPSADPPATASLVDMEMVAIPPGTFKMGSGNGNEAPIHEVSVPAFELGKHEVTVEQFQKYVEANPNLALNGCSSYAGRWVSHPSSNWKSPGFEQTPKHPVVCVSFVDAQGFVQWLNKGSRNQYRLASEAEWEYAARSGIAASRYWSNTEDTCDYAITAYWPAVCASRGLKSTAAVGERKPNAFGLYDMLGNASEWTEDWWNSSYGGAPTMGEPWKTGDRNFRVVRGGAWIHGLDLVRSEFRDRFNPVFRSNVIGFRVARSVSGAP